MQHSTGKTTPSRMSGVEARGRWAYPYRRALTVGGLMDQGHQRLFADVAERLSAFDPELIVDVGCGSGQLSLAVAARSASRPLCLLVDKDIDILAVAAANHRANRSRARPVLADIDALPFSAHLGARRPVILLSHVLYYSPTWKALLARALRLAEEGRGCCVIVARTHRSDSYRLRRIVKKAQGREIASMIHTGVVADWLTDNGTAFLALTARTTLGVPFAPGSGSSFRDVLLRDAELRNLLTLMCHHDPCDMEPLLYQSIVRTLDFESNPGISLTFESQALIAPAGVVA